ncbi:MAG: UDP-N-acetyl glucosamine 2-epimerase [Planctomycetaceae bacterium]|nr:UDP-N-acetyl glucosamine 2-epimerase [Planctomycetaceae bacterium]
MLLVSEPSGIENLVAEGHSRDKIHLVGNVMIDTLLTQLERAKQSPILENLGLCKGQYGVVTLHRPANVDSQPVLEALVNVLLDISDEMPLVFPIHPRTKSRLEEFDLGIKLEAAKNIHCIGPAGYLDFLCLTSNSKFIVTDSGGLQEESTALGIPCLTMRPSTERPVTSTEGTSTLIGSDADKLENLLRQVIQGDYKCGKCPDLWDGKAAERIAKIFAAE